MTLRRLWTRLTCRLGFHWRLLWDDETVPPAYYRHYMCGWCKKALP